MLSLLQKGQKEAEHVEVRGTKHSSENEEADCSKWQGLVQQPLSQV